MPIKNPKIRSFLPIGNMLGFVEVENDSHPILILIPDRPLISASSICLYQPILPGRMLSRLVIGQPRQFPKPGHLRPGIPRMPYLPRPNHKPLGHHKHILTHDLLFSSSRRLGCGPARGKRRPGLDLRRWVIGGALAIGSEFGIWVGVLGGEWALRFGLETGVGLRGFGLVTNGRGFWESK